MERLEEYQVPEDIRVEFSKSDIPLIFSYLEKTFRVNSGWRKQYYKDLDLVKRSIPEEEFFFKFASIHLEKPLRIILRRNSNVIHAIARYIVRPKLAERRKKDKELKEYLNTNLWKRGG